MTKDANGLIKGKNNKLMITLRTTEAWAKSRPGIEDNWNTQSLNHVPNGKQSTPPVTLSHTWAYAVHFASFVLPIAASIAVKHVPIFAPKTIIMAGGRALKFSFINLIIK